MPQYVTERTAFQPVAPLHLIQAIRLSHALMESRFRVSVPRRHSDKFSLLRKKFAAQYSLDLPGAAKLEHLTVSHQEPITAVGSIRRPLVFPHAIVRHCRSLWKDKRCIPVSFSGLLTDGRSALIDAWCQANFPNSRDRLPSREPFLHRIRNKARKICGFSPNGLSVRIEDLEVWSSVRGRTFPIKSWDEEYWELLSRSRFVLCPSGDCIWSYRFFESILCGAMPIVEKPCDAYEGFVYKTMEESYADMVWDAELAEYNYRQCFDRITIPHDLLNEELESLLSR